MYASDCFISTVRCPTTEKCKLIVIGYINKYIVILYNLYIYITQKCVNIKIYGISIKFSLSSSLHLPNINKI